MFKLKLLQKELVVVAVLLLLELVLIATFKLLVNQSEAEAASVEKSEQIMSLTSELNKNLWDDTMAWGFFAMTSSDEYLKRWKSLNSEMLKQSVILQKLTAGFPEDRLTTVRMVQAFTLAKSMEPQVDALAAQAKESGGTSPIRSLLRQRWGPWITEQITELTNLSAHHSQLSEAQKTQLSRSKSLLGTLLVLSGAMQLVLAVMLVVSFNSSITRRLKILKDNSLRLAGGQLLHSRMKGSDEIAELDSVFHAMATALTESAIKQRAIVDGMPVGFVSLSSDGVIKTVNPRTQQMLKANAEEFIGQSLSSVVVAPDDTAIDFEKIRKSAFGRIAEFGIRRADGTVFPAELSISAIRVANQEQLICNLLDVSERHDVERMKQEFVSMVSHDLKTPLTAIKTSLHLLEGGVFGPIDQRGKKVIDSTKNETERLIRLVTNLLDIARMESGRIDLDKSEVDLKSVIERSVDAVRGVANKKNIKLESTQSHLVLVADADRLVQVVVNVLSNAIKFSPPDSTIEISCHQLANECEVRVADQGPGIPESAQKRIFQRFEQVSASDRTEKGGAGLGLAICKLIIEAHGGTIGVESQLGKGSTFWLRVPHVCRQDNKAETTGD